MSGDSSKKKNVRKPDVFKDIEIRNVFDAVDAITKRIRAFTNPQHRLESLLFLNCKLAMEIDHCRKREKMLDDRVKELEKKIKRSK